MLFVLVRCLCLGLDIYVNSLFFQSRKDMVYVLLKFDPFVKKTICLMLHAVVGLWKVMVYVICFVNLKMFIVFKIDLNLFMLIN